MLDRKHEEVGRELEARQDEVGAAALDAVNDAGRRHRRRPAAPGVRLVPSRCCRPRRAWRSRSDSLGGLTAAEIARAFLVSEPTIAQRIVRAKRTLVGGRRPVRSPARRGVRRPPLVGAAGDLPDLQRGLLGDRGRRLAAAGALRRRAPPRPRARRARADEPEVHGLVALMEIQASRSARARRAGRANRSCCSIRTARAGITCSSAVAWRRSSARNGWAARSAPTRCRRRSPPATRGRGRRRTPTGRASPRSTTCSPGSRPHPSSISIAPWRTGWRSGRRQASSSWTR